MTYTIVTQCRLCSRRFEETVVANAEGLYLVGRGGAHPWEDGSPWCPSCWEGVTRTAARLLDSLTLPGVT
jgi:hypothetical protein